MMNRTDLIKRFYSHSIILRLSFLVAVLKVQDLLFFYSRGKRQPASRDLLLLLDLYIVICYVPNKVNN